MSVKQDFLELLKKNKGEYISGEEAAERLGCSRGAVWKAVKSLEDEGYSITGISNRGYKLNDSSDVLSAEAISEVLGSKAGELNIHIHKVIDSTNNELKRMSGDCPHGSVVIANEQTAGRGRAGRSFFSPAETGLYMSILLRPDMSAEKSTRITTAAACAVAEAIETVTGQDAGIKWINDIYINDKKVCGILTEASFSMENGQIEYVVVGIGINLYSPENKFPDEIKDIAGYILPEKKWSSRNQLAGEVLKNFMNYYDNLDNTTYLEGYKKRLLWKNSRINIISGPNVTPATLLDVDNECHLIVQYDNGQTDNISTGEISIRRNTDNE